MTRLGDLRSLLRLLEDGGADAARLAALAERIVASPGPPSAAEARVLERVRARAGGNLRRIGARLAGLRDAQALLERLKQDRATRTYGPAGQVQKLDAAPAQLLARR